MNYILIMSVNPGFGGQGFIEGTLDKMKELSILADKHNFIVAVDDVDLPLGNIRIRPKGGDGSHRGMESIIYQLRSDKFPRIRIVSEPMKICARQRIMF